MLKIAIYSEEYLFPIPFTSMISGSIGPSHTMKYKGYVWKMYTWSCMTYKQVLIVFPSCGSCADLAENQNLWKRSKLMWRCDWQLAEMDQMMVMWHYSKMNLEAAYILERKSSRRSWEKGSQDMTLILQICKLFIETNSWTLYQTSLRKWKKKHWKNSFCFDNARECFLLLAFFKVEQFHLILSSSTSDQVQQSQSFLVCVSQL